MAKRKSPTSKSPTRVSKTRKNTSSRKAESTCMVRRSTDMPPKEVSFEVVVRSESGASAFAEGLLPTVANLNDYRPTMSKNVEVARKLQRHGIRVHHVGSFSVSASCSAKTFEEFFSTNIAERTPKGPGVPAGYKQFAPSKSDPFSVPKIDQLDRLIERAYIQHEPLFFSGERPIPPLMSDKFRLRVPNDVAQLMRASSVHKSGVTGKGVRVAMPDTGFYHHPYFVEQGYNFLAVTAPDATDPATDDHGHGTGESANLFATAPDINFIGVKMGWNPTLAFKTAVELRPDIISNSWGYSVDTPGSTMPNWLIPLYLAVLDAVNRGITVCFSAGNGHFGFPGSMPEVISVGGVVVSENLDYSATNYTSGFASTWFPGRNVPDVSGLCGTLPTADYIILPVEKGAALDLGTGWGAFSGTSAACPMVAGVCALLKQLEPQIAPEDIRNILKYTARDIVVGTNAHGEMAVPGPDLATGYGLVDAERAVNAVR